MSAIAGILCFNGAPVETGLIQKLTSAMRARGPDAQTRWVQGSVALGHCMLRATPESLQEHQPLKSRDEKLVLVWDGRLDNRDALCRELRARGAVPRDDSDAELVLQSYAIWAEESPQRLLGDFAFAVWDAARKRLFCARDHMGARPFFYARNERFFAFASEEEALPVLPGVSSRPNEELVAYFLVQSFVDFDCARAWLEDVRILPAAGRLTIASDGQLDLQEYWRLEPGSESAFASDEQCHEAFLEVFGEAVRCRTRSSGGVAAMMSGGLDSASIAAMIARLSPSLPGMAFHTYSAISDYPETCVESRCIRELTSSVGDKAHFVSVPSFAGILDVKDLIDVGWSRPHPVDNSILMPALLCLAASRDGNRVMLHGGSGDLTMHAPIRYIARLLRAGRWLPAWQECRNASSHHSYVQGIAPAWLLSLNIWTAYAPAGLKLAWRALRARTAGTPLSTKLIQPALAERFQLVSRMHRREQERAPSLMNLQQEQIDAMSPPHGISDGLEGYDRVAGRRGIELRDPWADKRVVEFFLRLPLKYKVRDGWTKYLVRTAFATELGTQIRWRPGKEHLGWNFTCRLMDETQGLVADGLENGLASIGGFVDATAVRTRYAEYCASRGDAERQDIYDIITLIRWVQRITA